MYFFSVCLCSCTSVIPRIQAEGSNQQVSGADRWKFFKRYVGYVLLGFSAVSPVRYCARLSATAWCSLSGCCRLCNSSSLTGCCCSDRQAFISFLRMLYFRALLKVCWSYTYLETLTWKNIYDKYLWKGGKILVQLPQRGFTVCTLLLTSSCLCQISEIPYRHSTT